MAECVGVCLETRLLRHLCPHWGCMHWQSSAETSHPRPIVLSPLCIVLCCVCECVYMWVCVYVLWLRGGVDRQIGRLIDKHSLRQRGHFSWGRSSNKLCLHTRQANTVAQHFNEASQKYAGTNSFWYSKHYTVIVQQGWEGQTDRWMEGQRRDAEWEKTEKQESSEGGRKGVRKRLEEEEEEEEEK